MNSTDDAERIVHLLLKQNNIFPKEVRAILSPTHDGGFKVNINNDCFIAEKWKERLITIIGDALNSSSYKFVDISHDSYVRSDNTASLTFTATILPEKTEILPEKTDEEYIKQGQFIGDFYELLGQYGIDKIISNKDGGLTFSGKDIEVVIDSDTEIVEAEQVKETLATYIEELTKKEERKNQND